jgi:hypothetical protein
LLCKTKMHNVSQFNRIILSLHFFYTE